MWQPPVNKHFQEISTSNVNNTQPNELAANLLHIQKLQLADLLPPLTAAPTSVPQSIYGRVAGSSLLPNIPTISLRPPSPTLVNNLQQYLKQRASKTFAMSPSAQWPSTITHSDNRNLLLSNSSLLAANAVGPISPPPNVPFLPPPPRASLPIEPQISPTATVLNMLPLDILTETFSRLNALHLTNPSLAQTFTQLVAATSVLEPANASAALHANQLFATSGPTIPHLADSNTLSSLSPSLPTNKNLHTPQHLNLFKQYLSMEQQQLQQHLSALKDVSKARVHAGAKSSCVPRINEFYSASVNLNPISASLSNTSNPSHCSSNKLNCDKLQHQRSLRKRRDDLKDLLNQKSNSSPITEGEPDYLLPPPKKKWIRHYLKANNHHQMHVQNGNNSNSNNSMMVDEVPPTQQHHSSSSQHSPPRHISTSLGTTAGSHYMHMINAASSQQVGLAGSGANHVTHATPRRRTISSTSNGAGTREVHNKLEKNRRAHLKECYEALKNQLSLKDEDRRKTSNLAILGEALKCVQSFQKRNQELEAEWEHLANDKINLQKRIVSLKRELGPKYEQIFSGIFPDIEVGSIPSEREIINETHSLSSGRGSALYSSSSSLSSGGSNGNSNSGGGSGSNTLPSPVGAGLQTAMPTTITPVINKINNSNINSTSPILINSNSNVVVQRKNPSIATTIQAVTIPTQGGGGGGGVSSSPAGSPTALVTFGNSLPLSLTAKNISATAVTRGSPTPSTPSPSPSSSSGVSSSSSLISSSPPINGVINNGRNVTLNIPNGLKLQAAGVSGTVLNGSATTTSTAATILSSSAPAQGVNNTNNVLGNQQHNGRKKNLTSSNNNNNINFISNTNNVSDIKSNHQQLQQQQQHVSEDGEQPAKFLKVFNSSSNTATNGHHHHPQQQQQHHNQNDFQTHGQKLLLTSNGGILTGGGCGNGTNNNNNNSTMNKSMTNGSTSYAATPATLSSTSELCRLPGGAELNILPSNGLKISSNNAASVATAFYHANGKITFINGPPAHHPHQYHQYQHPPSSPLPNSTTITSNGTTTLTNGILLKDATSVTPLLVSTASSAPTSNINGLHFAGNFAQLLAAANTTATAANNASLGNNGTTNATASIVPMATNFQNIAESKGKTNNKGSIASWRSGAATTN